MDLKVRSRNLMHCLDFDRPTDGPDIPAAETSFNSCSAVFTLLVLTNFRPFSHGSSLVEAQEPSPSRRVDSPKRNDPASRRFEITQMGEVMNDGVRLSFTAFKAADGTKLMVEHHEFESKD
jgi:hypothetical protein